MSKAVYLSSIGAERAGGIGLITGSHLLEETLGDLPFSHAVLRAGWFFENSAAVASARNEGEIMFQLHPIDRKFPLVATAGIGKVGAETLTRAGPESAISKLQSAFCEASRRPSR
jgi:NAD(P)H dehydrogenase (quinone)